MHDALEPLPERVATSLPVPLEAPQIPPVPPLLDGTATPDVRRRVEKFYQAIERIFERLGQSEGECSHPPRLSE
ncbi:MAG: hypothetical protein ACR2JB_28785 [Bryobacteraceae bacterium]